MTNISIEAQWIGIGAAALLLAALAFFGVRAYQRRARRKSLLARLERVALAAAHQVLVPDGMGGFIHIDHILLTPRGILVLDTRRVTGLIFGGDQMSDWTVMGRGHRYTFDNPQPALYDRIAAVKALVGDVPVEGRLLFSNVGKFTKGIPKWVVMLDGIEMEFPVVDRRSHVVRDAEEHADTWSRLVAQLRPSPHLLTNL
ncbi:MAG: NERD domain-containing protein [Pseudomonadota bacterium]|nr:NERD domain-containing protein [Pseudomonadota bacterium]